VSLSPLADSTLEALDRTGSGMAIHGAFHARGSDIASKARTLADGLVTAGVEPGEPVALLALPSPDAFAAFLALRLVGAAVLVVEPYASREVTRARLSSSGVRLALISPKVALAAGPFRRAVARRGIYLPVASDMPELTFAALGAPVPGVSRPLSRVSLPPRHKPAQTQIGDAVLVPTSGTTGSPRSVIHSDASLCAASDAVLKLVRMDRGGHIMAGTFFAALPALRAGVQIYLPEKSIAKQVRAAASVDLIYVTPPELRGLLNAGVQLSGARVFAGSAPVSVDTLRRTRAAGASEAWGVYALTEMLPVSAVEYEEKSTWTGDGDLLGAPCDGAEVRVIDGLIQARGPMMAHRYFGEPPNTWIDTGDVGALDAQGRVVLHGRAKDMILRRAENIYPGLYEPSLNIAGVAEAVMVGVSAFDGDEVVVVVAELEDTADRRRIVLELRRVIAGMGGHKADYLVLTEVPRSGRSRKPDRIAASQLATQLIATHSESVIPC